MVRTSRVMPLLSSPCVLPHVNVREVWIQDTNISIVISEDCMGSSTGSQRHLAGWMKRLMAPMFRSKNRKLNLFLPWVTVCSSCEVENGGRIQVLSTNCSLSDEGNSWVLGSRCDGSSVSPTSVKVRSLQFKVKDHLDLCKRNLMSIMCYRVGNSIWMLLWHVVEDLCQFLSAQEGPREAGWSSTSPLKTEGMEVASTSEE